ncbi:MAG: DEAD/DEAH box helicase family protein [candidate division WOR-3 bacterium]
MKIEKYLVLNRYLLSLFGFSEPRDLFNQLKDKNPGYDSDGRSYFVNTLLALDNLRISRDHLLQYDERIRLLVQRINARRELVTLKYFQYLAVLFTEIVLDNLKNRQAEFLYELNEFLHQYKQEQGIDIIEQFAEDDLRKLAFWMATGSGKTLIMHINYYQFQDYKLFTPDNIILITPNEGLSQQHFDELMKSGIPAQRYTGSLAGGLKRGDEVLVIEMTKFVEEKKGGGVTLPVDTFEGKNLVFVDEGHKGRRSEEQKWAKLRNRLAENGFVFEYSATFGQILSEQNRETLKEYAKSIIYDYSYKYFYLDGYGKDFAVVNVTRGRISQDRFQQTMFIANLLSFYQQMLIYESEKQLAREYNLEKPLWIFVGTTVTGEKEESDIVQIVELFKGVIANEEWVRATADKILNGKTGLKDENGNDIFAGRFDLLKSRGFDFDDIYQRVFGGRGALGVFVLKNAEGEIGLKTGDNDYFGVINIGDVGGFRKMLENKGISVSEDVIRSSLFDEIKTENTKLNVLIGAKKFIEGWDTWRVSSMGLLNIGSGQGPQIIQLFGRGVRLKGKGKTLQRSGDERIKHLETLNIYGIKADYLSRFLEAIKKEEIEYETILIPVQPLHQDKWDTLHILVENEGRKFEEEEVLQLKLDRRYHCALDLMPRVTIYQSAEKRQTGVISRAITSEKPEQTIPAEITEMLDWERFEREIYEYKAIKGYWNLVFTRNDLQNLLHSNLYSISAPQDILEVKNKSDIIRLEDIAIMVVKKYLDTFYRHNARRFETENLRCDKLGQLMLALDEPYVVQVDKTKRKLIRKIKKLAQDLKELWQGENADLPRIYFDRHLYVPILLKSKEIDKITPEGLVNSEKKFVKGIREYLKSHQKEFQNYEIFLLRNLPKSGVGFRLTWSGFYPDFIMWVKKGNNQYIVFIDPKGLVHSKGLDDEKIVFAGFTNTNSDAVTIKAIEEMLNMPNIRLKSFILSFTPYNELIKGMTEPPSQEEYEQHHVLFLDDDTWPQKLFSILSLTYH